MLIREKKTSVSGDLGGTRVKMEMDSSATVHFMNMLSNIYSDTLEAIVREYATNSIDSHIEAGNKSPVKITTPNAMNPYLVIEDFGVGMNQQTVEDTYSRYGSSTKRNSNDFNGQLGIGAKVGLAYGTRSFTIRSVKDGQKTLVNVGYDPNDGPYMDIVDVSETKDPNGTAIKIQINASDVQDVANKARKFARYSQFPVLVNGKLESGDFIKIDENVFYETVDNSYSIRDYVIMGNVAYPLKTSVFANSLKRTTTRAIFYVEMGEVDFAPNREELIWNSFTQAKIDELTDSFEEKFINFYKEKVENSADAKLARLTILDAPFGHPEEFSYKGKILTLALENVKPTEIKSWSVDKNNVCRPRPNSKKNFFESMQYAVRFGNRNFISSNKTCIFVVDKKDDELFHTKHLYKTFKKAYEDEVPSLEGNIIFIDSCNVDDFFWTPDVKIVNYSDLESMPDCHPKVTRPKRNSAPKTFSLGRLSEGKYIQESVVENKKQILYISREEVAGYNSQFNFYGDNLRKYQQFAKTVDSENTEVYFATSMQEARLLKLFPSAKHFVKYYQDIIDQELDNLTDAEYDEFLEDQVEWGSLKRALYSYKDKILDPAILKLVDNSGTKSVGTKKVKSIEKLIFRINGGSEFSYLGNENYRKIIRPDLKEVDLKDRYPLLDPILSSYEFSYNPKSYEHVLIYVNAVYRQEQENK